MEMTRDDAVAVNDGEFAEMEFLVDGARGIHAPQFFAECHGKEWGIFPDDMAVLLAGPDHAQYWETWDDVWTTATLEQDGKTWHLHCDCGDIFMVVYRDEEEDEHDRA